MVEPLDLQVNLAQQIEVGRMQQGEMQQVTVLHQHLATKLELQTENAQTSVQTTQPSEKQHIKERKNNNKNPFWWKRQHKKKERQNTYFEKDIPIPHPIKGKVIDVWR